MSKLVRMRTPSITVGEYAAFLRQVVEVTEGSVGLVKSADEIRANMATLDRYLNGKREPEYSYALSLVKRGTCFVADDSSGEHRFYPSRFIGYADNTKSRHENNGRKNGRETNPAISAILGRRPSPDAELEKAYREYCGRLGFAANETGNWGAPRKFWKLR